MATSEQRNQVYTEAKEKLGELSQVDVKALARRDLGPFHFDESVSQIHAIHDVMCTLNERELDRLPIHPLQEILAAATEFSGLIDSIQKFDPTQGDPNTARASILRQVEDTYDTILQRLMSPLAFTSTEATNYQELERAARGCLAEIESKQQEFESFIAKSTEDAKAAVEELRKQVAEGGVSENAQFFATDSKKHEKKAAEWRNHTKWALITTFLYAALALGSGYIDMGLSNSQVVQVALGKLIVLSVLSYAVFWCVRNYRSEKHNETLNKHRANALQTFRTFVEGSDDPRVRDAILLHTANAAFEVRGTGYDKETVGQATNPVVDVLGRTLQQQASGE